MTKIGKYELLQKLGEGSYGVVYLARNPVGVRVALKLLKRGLTVSEKIVVDFQREAKLAMTLRHANILTVLDIDEAGGDHFIVMDYLEGQRLDQLLEDGKPLEFKQAMAVLNDLAVGLDYAHRKGVLHRDLKPKNVMVLAEDGRAVMLDFGLAREMEGGGSDTGTGTSGLGRGTAGYMAPEQIRRQQLTAQTDLYALGVVAYRLLVGRLPFEGDEFDVLEGHVRRNPPEACQLNSKLPQEVSAVLNRALAKAPAERYKSAAELVDALVKAFQPPPPTPAPRVAVVSPPPPAAQPRTRVREKDGMVEVYIPAGEFLMGEVDNKKVQVKDDEKPQHRVYLDSFWMDRTPVTNAMFARFLNERGNKKPDNTNWYMPMSSRVQLNGKTWKVQSGFEHHPMVLVSWDDALAYCDWVGSRLPSEAQWEKAARGTDGRKYPWGSQEPDATLANFNNNIGGTTPVGSYPSGASPYGVLDMAGNVWEWCADWYSEDYYKVSPPRNPTGPASGSERVLRGGSWSFISWTLRVAMRENCYPNIHLDDHGFRCIRREALS